MRTLILLRHGKSDWNVPGLEDHDRPLAKRGQRAAATLGRFLRRAGQLPDAIVTSSAVRARSTVEAAMEAGEWTRPLRVTDALYDASLPTVLDEIHATPDDVARLLLVGHEPTWSSLAIQLIGGGEVAVPTACAARIDFEVETWREVAFGEGTLLWLVPPRLFTDGDFDL